MFLKLSVLYEGWKSEAWHEIEELHRNVAKLTKNARNHLSNEKNKDNFARSALCILSRLARFHAFAA